MIGRAEGRGSLEHTSRGPRRGWPSQPGTIPIVRLSHPSRQTSTSPTVRPSVRPSFLYLCLAIPEPHAHAGPYCVGSHNRRTVRASTTPGRRGGVGDRGSLRPKQPCVETQDRPDEQMTPI